MRKERETRYYYFLPDIDSRYTELQRVLTTKRPASLSSVDGDDRHLFSFSHTRKSHLEILSLCIILLSSSLLIPSSFPSLSLFMEREMRCSLTGGHQRDENNERQKGRKSVVERDEIYPLFSLDTTGINMFFFYSSRLCSVCSSCRGQL